VLSKFSKSAIDSDILLTAMPKCSILIMIRCI
jgi:hypothetical protein